MKFKITALFKFFTVLICLALMLPLLMACGEKAEEADSSGTTPDSNAAGGEDVTTIPPTDPPTEPEPTEPPPTEPPTEPIDPNLPYYDYLDVEFGRFGFSGGDRIVADTEDGVAEAFRAKASNKIALDVSGDGVPFTAAYRYEVPDLVENFWDAAAETNYSADKTIAEGDILAGCVYVRDGGGENPAQLYFAIKTPTNDWGSEGDMSINSVELEPGEGWQKIYFTGEFSCDEDPASTAIFCMFLGYEPHTIDIGGIYMMRYPATSENIKATMKVPAY